MVGELREAEAALDQLAADHYAAKLLGRSEYLTAREALARRIEDLQERYAKVTRGTVLDQLAADGEPGGGAYAVDLLTRAWEAGDLEWRRTLIGLVVERVTVGSALPGRNFFDPARVSITWRR